MRHKNSRKTVTKKRRAGGRWHLPSFQYGQRYVWIFISIICAVSLFVCSYYFYKDWKEDEVLKEQQEGLKTQIENTDVSSDEPFKMPTAGEETILEEIMNEEYEPIYSPVMLDEYKELYEQNNDLIGWLYIEGTEIDYPVMQTPEDENYYLYRDFEGQENKNGCLILDTDSVAGVGLAIYNYEKGMAPSTNLIIHGHTMKSGAMFGNLDYYEDEQYGLSHSTICFDSLYEKREYELIAVFYSQVYYQSEDVFKYYKFFQADTQEEFDDWYNNIMELSLYDTGVRAEFGDEFITLSCCAYHVEDGRFVVVGKRIH